MKKGRTTAVLYIVAVLLIASLFLFACSDLTLDEPPVAESDTLLSDEVTEDVKETPSEQATEEDGLTENADTSGEGATKKNQTDISEDKTADEYADLENGDGDTSDDEEELIIKDGYIRMSSLSSDADWVLSVMGEEIGQARVAADGYLVTSDLTEGNLELWGKVNEYDRLSYYVHFESTGKYHEVYFREETLIVQIDLNAEERALLRPTNSLENDPKVEDRDDADQDAQAEEKDKNNPSDTTEMGNDVKKDQTASSETRCPICDVLLTENAGHLPECSNYATIPPSSAAHDFLDALPGVRENLDVTVIDEKNEIYAVSLKYLTAEGANAVRDLMCSCTVLNETLLGDGSMEYRVQKSIGSKMFTLVTRVTFGGSSYSAQINLSGFAVK